MALNCTKNIVIVFDYNKVYRYGLKLSAPNDYFQAHRLKLFIMAIALSGGQFGLKSKA